ncbi:LysM peptidoglycan-binding domain-containing protein [Fredinandcohnia humi]
MKITHIFLISLLVSLVIPLAPAQAARNSPDNIYEVKVGDTLPDIAKKYDTSSEEIKLTNGMQSDLLLVGQKLWVPITYEVIAGDTIEELASKYHSSVETIKSANKLTNKQLYAGQILKINPKRMTMQGQHILMTKEEFQEWLFNNIFKRKINLIQQHHTWIPSYNRFNGSNHFQLLKGMESYHINKMGWKTIAQNITTFPDGKIAVSRPFNMAPEGSIGPTANSVGIAIEHVGNFDLGQDMMTKEQKDTIIYINALLCIKFGLTPSIDSITYHHWWNVKTGERVLDKGPDYNVKTCPGTGFFGGNSTTSAKKYFYPLISRKMEEIIASMD